jgi:nitrogen fixation/metabolism regulation signal transduction histidine kinase
LNIFITIGSIAMLFVGLGLLYLLAEASSNRELFERNYARLFIANVFVAAAISLSVLWVAWRLLIRIRQKRFGSRLLLKLAVTFALVGFAPGLLIYGVSYQFVSRSIESWFDAKVQSALDAGLSLGRVSLDALASDLARKSRSAAEQLAQAPSVTSELQLGRIAELLGADEVTLWSPAGQLVASSGAIQLRLSPNPPSNTQIRLAKLDRVTTWFEGLDEATSGAFGVAQVKALVQVDSMNVGLGGEPRYLLVAHPLPSTLVSNALAVESVSREYQERALSLAGLKRMYIGTLTLGLFLAVFGALLLALALGNQIAQPLLLLAEGVEQVAAGDLRPKVVWDARDELGGLTRAFAGMTHQLAEARKEVQCSLMEVDAARGQLQTILDNLTAGVLVTNFEGVIRTANPAAGKLLGLPIDQIQGRVLKEFANVQPMPEVAQQQFEAMADSRNQHSWQQTIEIGLGNAGSGSPFVTSKTLVVRGASLPSQERLLVFDDITDVVSAQRAQAWGEVARRLAHEIKNPLTPIQLSAERLERRLLQKLDAVDRLLLEKSVRVIVEQVDAMKRLVNEFRDFARLPNAELKPLDLVELIRTVALLYEEHDTGRLELDLQEGCPRIAGDAQQLRQVIHNLVQNALEAYEESSDHVDNCVRIVTQWTEGSGWVRLLIQDNGPGFPDYILRRAFEPYVTTKKKGTGLGLAVVKKIADDHRARIELSNRYQNETVIGSQVSLSFKVASVDEGAGIEQGTM